MTQLSPPPVSSDSRAPLPPPEPVDAEIFSGRAAAWLGWIGAVIGAIIVVGWWLDRPLLKSFLPGQVEAKANTGICFLLFGVALALKSRRNGGGQLRIVVGNTLATLAAAIGLVTVMEYVLHWNAGLDQLFFVESEHAVATVNPGRMAVPSALNFLFLGLALALSRRRLAWVVVRWLVILPWAAAGLAFAGYLFDLPLLTAFGPFTPIAAPTALAFLILCTGTWLATQGPATFKSGRDTRLIALGGAFVVLLLLAGGMARHT